MKLVVVGPEGRADVDVRVDPAVTTIADVARAIGAVDHSAKDRDVGLLIDEVWAPGDLGLLEGGLHEGAIVSLPGAPAEAVDPEGLVEVCIVGGLDAGARVALGAGRHAIGRSSTAAVPFGDRTVSREHAVLEVATDGTVKLTDKSGGRTFVDGHPATDDQVLGPQTVVETGAVAWVVRPPVAGDLLTGTDRFRDMNPSGVINLNRPPRYAATGQAERVKTPKPPDKPNKPPFNPLGMMLPAVGGVAMVFLLHSYYFLAFAGMTPIMAIGNWWETKHRSTKSFRGDNRRYAGELLDFEKQLGVERGAERSRRRERLPDVAEVLRRVRTPSIHVWERRVGHDDFGTLSAGIGDTDWTPDLGRAQGSEPLPLEINERLALYGRLSSVPLAVDLDKGGVIGVVGDRASALAVARSLLVQAAVHHGPADLRIAVVAVDATAPAWDWAKWLPHARDHRPGPSDLRLFGASAAESSALVESLIASRPKRDSALSGSRPTGPVTLLVVDGEELLAGRASPARGVLRGDAGPACGIVVAATSDRLPSLCTSIITVDDSGAASLAEPRLGLRDQELLAAGLSEDAARDAVRILSRYEDPELMLESAILPELVPLPAILDMGDLESIDVSSRWAEQAGRNNLRAPIGAAQNGQFWLDFDRHGPHGLIGGTTGSGKSELLKTLVAAFAAMYPPSELTFGLFDFKGGSTFVEFADMPHTVGMASDLDVSLARRALQCLRAELLHRERVFDVLGAKDLIEFRERRQRVLEAGGESVPEYLPRLVVIIDEFAALASELAEEIGALTDLTARGRSLGVHLLLATQKPSTAVNAEIRTNTRLRISLQVEDSQDSMDVVGVPDAAAIRQKGRGFFRVGSAEIVPIQTALASGKTIGRDTTGVEVSSYHFATVPTVAINPKVDDDDDGPGDLTRLVDSVNASFEASGLSRPRKPWPDPLPERFDLADLAGIADSPPPVHDPSKIYFALADDPAAQTRYPAGWSLAGGNLLIYGVVGSGTTTSLLSVALAFASSRSADQGHIYALDFGTGGLAPLEVLPHCGTVVPPTDRERQMRLIRRLREELQRRRQMAPADLANEPTIVLLIDNVEAFRTEFDDPLGMATVDAATRIMSEGSDAKIHVVATANRLGGVPGAISSATPQKLVLRLSDVSDYGTFSIPRKELPTFYPGRGVLIPDGRTVHVASPGLDLFGELTELAARTPAPRRAPFTVGSLPEELRLHTLPAGIATPDEWRIPIAMDDAELGPASLVLYEHEHATIAGAARSGKSTALLTLAAAVRKAAPNATVLGIATRRSPLRSHELIDKVAAGVDDIATLVDSALVASGPTLLLIDDSETIEDNDGRLMQLLSVGPTGLHVAIAGRADVLRTQYGHWTQTVRRSKAGLLLNPNLDLDGDLLGARLPTRLHLNMTQGRGFLVCDGATGLVQVALPG